MSEIVTTITADKEAFVAHLNERAADNREVANREDGTLSQKERFRYRGRAEGLELAAQLVAGWELPQD